MARKTHPSKQKDNNGDKTAGFIFDAGRSDSTLVDNWLFNSLICVVCFKTFTPEKEKCPRCKSSHFLKLPYLNEHQKITYIILKRYSPNIFPYHSTIARSASTSRETVKRAIAGLKNAGYLKVISGKQNGQANKYFLCTPLSNEKFVPSIMNERLQLGMELPDTEELGVGQTALGVGQTALEVGHTALGVDHTDLHNYTNNSINNNTTTTALSWFCFFCKKSFKTPKIDKDIFKTESYICPICSTNLIFDFSDIPLTLDNLLLILEANNPQDVHRVLDIIHFQYKGDEIIHHKKLLISLLKKGAVTPDGFIPYAERKLLAIKKEQLKKEMTQKQDEAAKAKEATEKKYFKEAQKRYDALSKTRKKAIRKDAIKSLPPVLKKHELAIENAIFKYMMEDEFV